MLILTVFTAKDPKDAEKYSVKMTLSTGKELPRKETSALLPVMPLEHFPETHVDLMNSDLSWHLPYSMYRKSFQVEGKMDIEVNISSIQW